MGFHLYQTTSDAASGMQKLHYLKPVRLSGEHGLIAHFIRAHPHEDLADWELKLEEIASITETPESDIQLIFCSQLEEDSPLAFSLVTSLTGKSNIMDTEVLILQQPIRHVQWDEVVDNAKPPASIRYPEQQKAEQVFESVLVKGGISRLKHTWKLAPPKMQIGGVIC